MKPIRRPPLSRKAERLLLRRSLAVSNSADVPGEVNKLWLLRNNQAFREIRKTLEVMASGRTRCMYCEDNFGTDIDHFWPKAVRPDLAFVWENYLLACSRCNSNFKRSQFPLGPAGEPLLINPTAEDPFDHLRLSLTTGILVGISPKGLSTIEVLGLDRLELEKGRQDAWIALEVLIGEYDKLCVKADSTRALKVLRVILSYPFSSVLYSVVRFSSAQGALNVPAHVVEVLNSRPELSRY